MERRKHALKHANLKKPGLEIGPLFDPLVSKKEGNIFYIDHMTADELKKKYDYAEIPEDEVVEVDYVLDETLQKTLKGKRFDYVLASHVIEHIPDMVTWLEDIESILKPGGILSLVIPDKRYTFDITRRISKPSDVIGAYLDKTQKSTSAMIYDYLIERRKVHPGKVWQGSAGDYLKLPRFTNSEDAYKQCLKSLAPEYVDAHCYTFTPHSFFEILRSLISHDLLGFEVLSFKDTNEGDLEFYVTLKKAKKGKHLLKSVPRLPAPKTTQQLELEIRDLKAKVAHEKKRTDELHDKIKELVDSRSWKLTKPLRRAASLKKHN